MDPSLRGDDANAEPVAQLLEEESPSNEAISLGKEEDHQSRTQDFNVDGTTAELKTSDDDDCDVGIVNDGEDRKGNGNVDADHGGNGVDGSNGDNGGGGADGADGLHDNGGGDAGGGGGDDDASNVEGENIEEEEDSGESDGEEEQETDEDDANADPPSEDETTEPEDEEEDEESVDHDEEEKEDKLPVEEPIKREHNLPDKPTLFQVRVRIIKACHLPGSNIDPSIRITVDTQKKQTKSRKGTNKPNFDETFFYNFNEKPDAMFDKIFEIQAFNTKGFMSSTLIGSFTCDIGMIYFQKHHAVEKKWILLSTSEESGGGRKGNENESKKGGTPAGYVQITAAVLGPGDELPERTKTDDVDDMEDLESNLWLPGGVKLAPATFMFKIYSLEDLPQMDSGSLDVGNVFKASKRVDRCDPYCKLSFAGKSIKTNIKKKSYNPEYNVELRLPFKFPSMCDRIQLQIYDYDRVGDNKIIGTIFISLSQISSLGGSDFLPSFGPCFINFYGSPREYSVMSSDYEKKMNEGSGVGAYYRGRALIEVSTRLGNHAATPKQTIKSANLLKIRPCLRRRKYKLFATFMSASGISESGDRVYFEVSIGNFGNSLDSHGEALSSTTPPVVPKFDGTQYYYMPWNESKPCCIVESHWEDISYRLEPMNLLRNITHRLEKNIEGLELAIKLEAINRSRDTDVASRIIKILDDFIEDCSVPLPQLSKGEAGVTKLDLKLQDIRINGLNSLQTEAIALKEEATDVEETRNTLMGYLSKLKELSFEPQNSLPDVVISMLKGNKRIAYSRLPSEDVLYSKKSSCTGIHCAKQQSIQLQVLGKEEDDAEANREIPATCDVILWLGLEEDQKNFVERSATDGKYSVYAETFENQLKKPIIGWSSDGCPRPAFSDSEGDFRLNKEFFKSPRGWKWEGDWSVAPSDDSLVAEVDEGRSAFIVSIYQNQMLNSKSVWVEAGEPYTDSEGKPLQRKEDVILPDKWEWTGEWSTDMNGICDENGWEYKLKSKGEDWKSSVRSTHKYRRRKLVRTRVKIAADTKAKENLEVSLDDAGWMYAGTFGKEYHGKQKTSDLVRRRKWIRKMVVKKIGHPPIFKIVEKNKKRQHRIMPNMVLSLEPRRWQLRAYIYQARNVMAMDEDGMSDPYAVVTFQNKTKKTRVMKKTLCPEWDETLMFEDLFMYGSPKFFLETTPYVCVNIYDKDMIGKDEFCGRCLVRPVVRLDGGKKSTSRLLWYPIIYNGKEHGELLAAFELFLDEGMDLPFTPPTKDGRLIVPNGIRPVIVTTGIELLCWGVRNLKKFQLAPCTSPSVTIQVGSYIIQSDIIKNTKKNPNFTKNAYFQEMLLPKEPLYMPPINIIVRDHRSFGRKPIVGTHVISTVFLDDPPSIDCVSSDHLETAEETGCQDIALTIEEEVQQKTLEQVDYLDWWAKYYASIEEYSKCGSYIDDGYTPIHVYKKELEKVEEFGGLNDYVNTFPLDRGHFNDDEEDGNHFAGEFKGMVKIYPLPSKFQNASVKRRYFSKIKSSKPEECTVRVYIIRAYDLTPKDDNGLADPFIVVKLGSKKVSTKDRYVPNEVNPIFGEYFELKCTIPVEKDLKIKVYDYDLIGRNDFIGETTIDLENRLLSKTRATVGLPPNYFVKGTYAWRDSKKPKEILESLCDSQPVYIGDSKVIANGNTYELHEFEDPLQSNPNWGPRDERLALHVLHKESFGGVNLVPEHVETRTLVDPLEPNMTQGQLEMFVDLFPIHLGSPGPPIIISPRKPKSYELRVIIWNTADVPCIDTNISGDEMVDIFLKGWLDGFENKSIKTDVHYNSLNGDGMFNWRMLFPMQYIPEESVMVVEQKEHFWSLDKTRKLLSPKLMIQVWDHDFFSPNEYIGSLELSLNKLLLPMKTKNQCSFKMLKPNKAKYVDLFQTKIAKGWWVMSGENEKTGVLEEKGKVEMTLEILGEEEAKEKEAGKGRDDPNMYPTLEKPDRPTRFGFFNNPFKAVFRLIWRRYKWIIIGLFFLALFLVVIALFGYYAIGYGTKKLIGA